MEFVYLWSKAVVCINTPKVVAQACFVERLKQKLKWALTEGSSTISVVLSGTWNFL